MDHQSPLLGKGMFGSVYKEGNKAVKKFAETDSKGTPLQEIMIQEVILLSYISSSPFVVSMKEFSLDHMEIKLELYDMNLTEALKTYKFTHENHKTVYRDVLKGVSHMHSLDLVHCDIKQSNILVRLNPLTAVVSDLGLSSLSRYGRFTQTPIGYRRPDSMLVSAHRHKLKHDYYSLAVMGAELFGCTRFKTQQTPEELQLSIQSMSIIPAPIKSMLIEFSKLDSKITICSYLRDMFDVPMSVSLIAMPVIDMSPNILPKEHDLYLKNTMEKMCTECKIRKWHKGYNLLKERFNNKKYTPVRPQEYILYIACTMLILSNIFGEPGFNYKSVQVATGGKDKVDINRVMTDIITKMELINIIMIAE